MKMSSISFIKGLSGMMKEVIGIFHCLHSILSRKIYNSLRLMPSKELSSKRLRGKYSLDKMEVTTSKTTNSESPEIFNKKAQKFPNQRRDRRVRINKTPG